MTSKKIEDVSVRRDGTVVIETKDTINVLFPNGDSIKIDPKTGKEKRR